MSRLEQADLRQEALSAAKSAVRSYSRDPSDGNATKVQEAWQRVRRLASDAVEQRMQLERAQLGRRFRQS